MSDEFVEALALRVPRGTTDVPLAEETGAISSPPEQFGHRCLGLMDTETGVVGALEMSSRQQRDSGGGAHGGCDVKIREAHALSRQPIHVGRDEVRGAVAVHVHRSLVVGKDEDDIRARPGTEGHSASQRQRGGTRGECEQTLASTYLWWVHRLSAHKRAEEKGR